MTYVVVARWRSREGASQTIEEILRELAQAVRQEPDNLQFTVHRSIDDPNEFLLYEQYRSEQAFLDHRQTSHFKNLVLDRAVPLLSSRNIDAYERFD